MSVANDPYRQIAAAGNLGLFLPGCACETERSLDHPDPRLCPVARAAAAEAP